MQIWQNNKITQLLVRHIKQIKINITNLWCQAKNLNIKIQNLVIHINSLKGRNMISLDIHYRINNHRLIELKKKTKNQLLKIMIKKLNIIKI